MKITLIFLSFQILVSNSSCLNDLLPKICGLMTTLETRDIFIDEDICVKIGERIVPRSYSAYKLREAMLRASEGETSSALEDV